MPVDMSADMRTKRLSCHAGYQEVSRCHTRGESEESTVHRWESTQGGFILAVKLRSGITRGIGGTTKRTLVLQNNVLYHLCWICIVGNSGKRSNNRWRAVGKIIQQQVLLWPWIVSSQIYHNYQYQFKLHGMILTFQYFDHIISSGNSLISNISNWGFIKVICGKVILWADMWKLDAYLHWDNVSNVSRNGHAILEY